MWLSNLLRWSRASRSFLSGITQFRVKCVGAVYALKVTLTTIPKLVPTPLVAHSSSASFSGLTAPVGRCWLGTRPMQRTCPESTLTTTAPMMASHESPWSLARCPMPPCSHSPAPTLGRAPNGSVTPASIGPTDDIPPSCSRPRLQPRGRNQNRNLPRSLLP